MFFLFFTNVVLSPLLISVIPTLSTSFLKLDGHILFITPYVREKAISCDWL